MKEVIPRSVVSVASFFIVILRFCAIWWLMETCIVVVPQQVASDPNYTHLPLAEQCFYSQPITDLLNMTLPVGSASWKRSGVTGCVIMTVTLYARCKTAFSLCFGYRCTDTWLTFGKDRSCFCTQVCMTALWSRCVSWQTSGTLFPGTQSSSVLAAPWLCWLDFAGFWFRCSFKPIRNSACFLISCAVILANQAEQCDIRMPFIMHTVAQHNAQNARFLLRADDPESAFINYILHLLLMQGFFFLVCEE